MSFRREILVLAENIPIAKAKIVAKNMHQALGLSILDIKKKKCSYLFTPKFNGYIIKIPEAKKSKRITLVLTNRELYWKNSKNKDQWIIGQTWTPTCVVSLRRIRGNTKVASEIAIHEVGHIFLSYFGEPKHYREFIWVDLESGKERLGRHCTDKRCVMYQHPGAKSPNLKEGYMLIDKKKTRGIGWADTKLYKDWFCKRCRNILENRIKT